MDRDDAEHRPALVAVIEVGPVHRSGSTPLASARLRVRILEGNAPGGPVPTRRRLSKSGDLAAGAPAPGAGTAAAVARLAAHAGDFALLFGAHRGEPALGAARAAALRGWHFCLLFDG